MAEPEYPVLRELETKLKLQWIDTDDYLATQRAIIEVTPDHAYLELPRGRKGDKGDPGNAISFQGIVARTSDLPTGLGASDAAKAWVNTATKALHVWNGNQWFTVNNFAGVEADVQRFSQWFAQAADAARTALEAADRAEYWANETIQQVTGDFATRNYADSKDWFKGFIDDTHQTMADVPVGLWGISAQTHASRLGLPTDFGTLQVMTMGSSRAAFFIGRSVGLYINTSQGDVWGEWHQPWNKDKWFKGAITDAHQTMADVGVGVWNIPARTHAVRLGLPMDYGSLQVMQIGLSKTAFFIGQSTGFWINSSNGDVWGEWQRPTGSGGSGGGGGASGLKTVGMALTAGSLEGGVAGRHRVLAQVTAPVTRWRVHVESRRMLSNDSSSFNIGNVYVGRHVGNGVISSQGQINSGWTSIPAGGEWVSAWLTSDLPSGEMLIDINVTGTGLYSSQATGWRYENDAWVESKNAPVSIWLELETFDQVPVVAMIGDSTGAGQGADRPVFDSALYIAAREQQFIPMAYTYPGSSMASINDYSFHIFQRWAHLDKPDSVIIQSGSNDIHTGASTVELQSRFADLVETAELISPVVIGATVKARYPDSGTFATALNAHNAFVKRATAGNRGYLDFYNAVSPTGTVASADAADASHLSTSGHQKMATAFNGVTLARPAYGKGVWERGVIAGNTDLNNYKTPGVYVMHSSTAVRRTVANLPSPSAIGVLTVTASAQVTFQEFTYWSNEGVKVARRQAVIDEWGPWEESSAGQQPNAETGAWSPTQPIKVWGDSLVEGGDFNGSWGAGESLPERIGALVDTQVINEGISGQTSTDILVRAGAIEMIGVPEGGEIPASGTVNVDMVGQAWDTRANRKSLPVYWAGVRGGLYLTSSGWTFTRSSSGDPVTVTDPEIFKSVNGEPGSEGTHIFIMGENDFAYGHAPEHDMASHIIANYERAIESVDHSPHRHVLVAGIKTRAGQKYDDLQPQTVRKVNDYLRRKYPLYYVDRMGWLLARGMEVLGFTPTPSEQVEISQGILPTRLFATGDDRHIRKEVLEAEARELWAPRLVRQGWAGVKPGVTLPVEIPATVADLRANVPPSLADAGSPEGKVAAPVGSTYTDTAATNGAVRWVKTSGTGSTGWRVEYSDEAWRAVPTSIDWNTLVEPGRYKKRSGAVGGTNIPPTSTLNAPGELYVAKPNSDLPFVAQVYMAYAVGTTKVVSNGIWWRSSNTSGNFSPWERLDTKAEIDALAARIKSLEDAPEPEIPAANESTGDAYSQHEMRKTMFMYAMGGPISTGGKAAVSFRFDHGMKNFAEKVLPITRTANLKVAQAVNPRNWARPENTGYTAADLNQWVADGDVEVWNHSASHIETGDPATQYDEIVNGLAELEAQVPAQGTVWGFMPPGTGSTYIDFSGGRVIEEWDNYPAMLLLKHHAVVTGYMPNTAMRVLDGTPRDGLGHYTLDKQTPEYAKGRIDQAIANKRGINFMVHPSLLDTEGYLTTAQFQEIVDYVVAKRDAGELVTLSPYEMCVAEVGEPTQQDADTGWRNIRSLISPEPASGSIDIRRHGSDVYVALDTLAISGDATFVQFATLLPAGFRPDKTLYLPLSPVVTTDATGGVRVQTNGTVTIYGTTGKSRATGTIRFMTGESWPTVLPGLPA